jgi:signal transduction histidine kinase
VLAWAVSGGRRRGAIAAILLGGCDLAARGHVTQSTLDGTVLLLLSGVAVGHVARLAVDAQERLQRAVEVEAANRERDRLARVIHDSVLQVLALVQRRGAELGGEAAELGRLAGEQETHLRVLVSAAEPSERLGLRSARTKATEPPERLDLRSARTKATEPPERLGLRSARTDRAAGQPAVDLRPLLTRLAGAGVSLATPADPVALPPRVAEELAAAVGAALANVTDHCGPDARAWVLVEDDGDAITVSVRDEGPGIPAGRLDRAAADGRLGVAQSIRGRMRELGGAVTITSTPGQGTEVELRIPKGTL